MASFSPPNERGIVRLTYKNEEFMIDEGDCTVVRQVNQYVESLIYWGQVELAKDHRVCSICLTVDEISDTIDKLDCLESVKIRQFCDRSIDFCSPPLNINVLARLPKLTEIDVNSPNASLWFDGSDPRLEFPTRITSLRLTNTHLPSTAFPKNLQTLELKSCKVLQKLQLPGCLEELIVHHSQCSGLLPHPALQTLQVYDLGDDGSVLGQDFVESLTCLTSLRTIPSPSLLRFSASYSSLKSLKMTWKGEDLPDDFLTLFPKLKSFTFDAEDLPHPVPIKSQIEFVHDYLEHLDLGGELRLDLNDLSGLPKLSHLCLGGLFVTTSTSSSVTFANLTILEIDQLQPDSFANFVQYDLHVPQLRKCDLYLIFPADVPYEYDCWERHFCPVLPMLQHCSQLQSLPLFAVDTEECVDQTRMNDCAFERIVEFLETHKFLAKLGFRRDVYTSEILGERAPIIEHLEKQNRINLGLRNAKTRVLGRQRISPSLWPLVLENSQKAFAADGVETEMPESDSLFLLLREKAGEEISHSR